MRHLFFTLAALLLARVVGAATAPDWVLETKTAGWQARDSQGEYVFRDRLWIAGGWFSSYEAPPRDVWSSADGREWKLETARATWSPRAYHQAVVLKDRIYVFGGGNYVPAYHAKNDVWSSADGVSWTRETESAPWHPRLWFSAAVYRGRIWVLGGWSNNPSQNWGDVWHSKDGRQWERLQSKVTWKERHEHSVFVFKDRLWVAGGHARPLSSEVWSLYLPVDFFGKE